MCGCRRSNMSFLNIFDPEESKWSILNNLMPSRIHPLPTPRYHSDLHFCNLHPILAHHTNFQLKCIMWTFLMTSPLWRERQKFKMADKVDEIQNDSQYKRNSFSSCTFNI